MLLAGPDTAASPAGSLPAATPRGDGRSGSAGSPVCCPRRSDPVMSQQRLLLARAALGARGRDERPVILPGRALLDPAAEQRDLALGQLAARIGRRHAFGCVGGGDALEQLALPGLAGHDGSIAAKV